MFLETIHNWWSHLSGTSKDAMAVTAGVGPSIFAYTASADAIMLKITVIGGVVVLGIRLFIVVIEARKSWRHRNDKP